MERLLVNAADGPRAAGGYSQACLCEGAKRILFVSGQVPVEADGSVPLSFEDQARLAWRNVERQLLAANMTLANIVKHTTFLSSRDYLDENSRVRREILGDLAPALTVVIADIYDEAWLLEIEVVAAA